MKTDQTTTSSQVLTELVYCHLVIYSSLFSMTPSFFQKKKSEYFFSEILFATGLLLKSYWYALSVGLVYLRSAKEGGGRLECCGSPPLGFSVLQDSTVVIAVHSAARAERGVSSMAEYKTLISSPASLSDNKTLLARALSNPKLNHVESLDGHPNAIRNFTPHGSRRKFSSSNSLSESLDSVIAPCSEARVLVINTGGTIGMKIQDDVLAPKPNAFVQGLRKLATFHDEQYAQQTGLYDFYDTPEKTLVLPSNKDNKRIVYTILEYAPLLDSCNMTTENWGKIGKDIEKNYEAYDGFVILHGTDTMAYTASALSFMCEHLGKPIILTGSQVPIYEMRSDGRDNLLGALVIAGQFVIPEVCLYFHNKLYRGNRVTKVDAGSFNAFASPNLPPLANMEVDITIDWDTVWRANTTAKFHVSTELNRNVGLLRLFPGITAATVRAFLQLPMEGVVLETYGSGNAPDNRADLLAELKEATDRGVIIINCTQCLRGTVSTSYATGKVLINAGLLAGSDMTPEAALSKLSYVLARNELDIQAKKKMMAQNLRGEMIADLAGAKLSLSDSRFIQVIAKSLSISCKEELAAIRDALTPPLACAAAKIGDVEALDAIRGMGSNLSLGDYDGRTPLHIAACEGHLKVVQYLLSHGATIHARDRYGDTPLSNAVRFRHKDIVKLLRKTGAHLSREELAVSGTELCSLAASGDLEGLGIWHLAGADLNTPGYDGRTAHSVARGAGKSEAVARLNLLLSAKCQDKLGEVKKCDEKDDDDDDGDGGESGIRLSGPPEGC